MLYIKLTIKTKLIIIAIQTLTDLNDYINPGQECIKPIEGPSINKDSQNEVEIKSEIKVNDKGDYFENDEKLDKAQITLNDCLACSGCITSAESVLIQSQSDEEVKKVLKDTNIVKIVSISPQSLASLSSPLQSSVDLVKMMRRLSSKLKSIGFDYVFDVTFARHLSLIEMSNEFKRKQRENLPLLASACPGWVCYAEKTHSELLPFISQVKSPQQIMGTLVKDWFSKKLNKSPEQIYHVTIMPCYDKKLEASRQDFYSDIFNTRDVDCVLTTGEISKLFDGNVNFDDEIHDEHLESEEESIIPHHIQHPGTSSGSYLHNLINLMSADLNKVRLETHSPRNLSDFVEYKLINDETGECVFKGIKCFGFKNIQNIVRRIGKDKGLNVSKGAGGKGISRVRGRKNNEDEKSIDFVEVMACPSGCINGGGQLKPNIDEEGFNRNWENEGVLVNLDDKVRYDTKNHIKKVEDLYWSNNEYNKQNKQKEMIENFTNEFLNVLNEKLLTQYHAIEFNESNNLNVQW